MRLIISLTMSFCILAGSVFAKTPKILNLKDLEPGTKAIGFSVFKGVEPESFDVVLGNIVDQSGDGFILARISGGPMETPLEKIGAIAGMSGSPIFIGCEDLDDCIENGVLVGALSYSIGYFIEGGMNVLLTPSEYMLGARARGYEAADRFKSGSVNKISIGGKDFYNLMLFPKMDSLSAQGGLSKQCKESVKSDIKPGSMVTVLLATGDFNVGGSGTVTWRDENSIYIFGHPLFGTGMVHYPFVQIAVADTLQTPLEAHKIAGCSLDTRGTMTVDGAFEMAGVIGQTAPTMSFKTVLRLGNGGVALSEEVAPSPMTRTIISSFPAILARQSMGDITHLSLGYRARILLLDEPEVFLSNIIPAEKGKIPLTELFNRIDNVFDKLEQSGFNYQIESINVRVDFINNFQVWNKKTAFLSQNKATPGDTLYINVVLEELFSGATKQISIPVKVPDDFTDRLELGSPSAITVIVQSGNRFSDKRAGSAEYNSLEEFIEVLKKNMNFRTNVLYVQQVRPKSKSEREVMGANAKEAAKKPWNWTVLDESDVKQLPSAEDKEIILSTTPTLNHYIDFNQTFNINVQPKKDKATEADKQNKKRKWFFLFLF